LKRSNRYIMAARMTCKVLITCAGTASAISIIKSLKRQQEIEVNIFSADSDVLSAGLKLADRGVLVPPISSGSYLDALFEIIKSNGINVLMPTFSNEIELFSRHSDDLRDSGVRFLLSSPETVGLCNDKFTFYQFCRDHEILAPSCLNPTDFPEPDKLQFPLFAKPNRGSSSTNTYRIDNHSDLGFYRNKFPDLIFQDFIDGEEYTVDILANRSHDPLVISPRIRIATKAGQMVKGKTVDKTPFVHTVNKLCDLLKVQGVCNVQFIKRGSDYYLIDMNPRFAAGGLMLTVQAGANIPLIYLKECMGLEIDPGELVAKSGVHMTRYWEEIFF